MSKHLKFKQFPGKIQIKSSKYVTNLTLLADLTGLTGCKKKIRKQEEQKNKQLCLCYTSFLLNNKRNFKKILCILKISVKLIKNETLSVPSQIWPDIQGLLIANKFYKLFLFCVKYPTSP